MDSIKSTGKSKAQHTNVSNETMCKEFCHKNKNCSLWTYHGARFYLKTQSTILIENQYGYMGYNLTAGAINCTGNGTINVTY